MTTVPAVATGQLLIGAVLGGVAWTAQQVLGGYLVAHQLQGTSEVYGVLRHGARADVMDLPGPCASTWARPTLVLARHLWPRSIVQRPLTEADRVALADIARQEERRPEEKVHVSFEPEGLEHTPQDDDDRPPPASRPRPRPPRRHSKSDTSLRFPDVVGAGSAAASSTATRSGEPLTVKRQQVHRTEQNPQESDPLRRRVTLCVRIAREPTRWESHGQGRGRR